MGVNSSSNEEDVYTIKIVETESMWLAKKAAKDYIKRYVEGEDVREYLKGGNYRHPVFMITGVKVARGGEKC